MAEALPLNSDAGDNAGLACRVLTPEQMREVIVSSYVNPAPPVSSVEAGF
jgi:hypothetical protein